MGTAGSPTSSFSAKGFRLHWVRWRRRRWKLLQRRSGRPRAGGRGRSRGREAADVYIYVLQRQVVHVEPYEAGTETQHRPAIAVAARRRAVRSYGREGRSEPVLVLGRSKEGPRYPGVADGGVITRRRPGPGLGLSLTTATSRASEASDIPTAAGLTGTASFSSR